MHSDHFTRNDNEGGNFMAKAKKLASGTWRCQVYDRTETVYLPDGSTKTRKLKKSFTAPTKRECERLAALWAATREAGVEDIRIKEALARYIASKENVLSPGTVREYHKTARNYFGDIENISIRKIDTTTIQVWISKLSARGLNPKTVRNIYTLLSSTLGMFRPDFHPRVTLPQRIKPNLHTPNDTEIRVLLNLVAGTELEIAVLLAAFGPMRRGEICALEGTDIDGNVVHVRKSMVLGENGKWIVKQPKTPESNRDIVFPDFVINKLPKSGKIINATPSQISDRFRKVINRSGLPHFRFHDLRHYAASILHAIGVRDQYIMQRGGWKTDGVMKSVYRNVIDTELERQTNIAIAYFEKVPTKFPRHRKK